MLPDLWLSTMDFSQYIALGFIEGGAELHSFIASTLGQMFLWGMATVAVFLFTAWGFVTAPHDAENRAMTNALARTTFGGVFTLMWIANVVMWYTNTLGIMIGPDTLMIVVALALHRETRKLWSLNMIVLCTIAVLLDFAYLRGLGRESFLTRANIVYGLQLFTISGIVDHIKFLSKPIQKIDDGVSSIAKQFKRFTRRLRKFKPSKVEYSGAEQNLGIW